IQMSFSTNHSRTGRVCPSIQQEVDHLVIVTVRGPVKSSPLGLRQQDKEETNNISNQNFHSICGHINMVVVGSKHEACKVCL
ncbi:hypothetical protein EGW08_015293, partial [Elysia chlorotica]